MPRTTFQKERRTFIFRTIAAIGSIPVLSTVLSRPLAFAAGEKVADPETPLAKTLGYHEDASKVDIAKYPKRAGDEGAKQLCSNCQLLTQGAMKVEGREGAWGKCALIQDGLVAEKGWCNSWVAKVG